MQLSNLTREERQIVIKELIARIERENSELATGKKRSFMHPSLWGNYGQGHKLGSITYQDDKESFTLKVEDFLNL